MAPAPSVAAREPGAPHMPAAAGSTTRQTKSSRDPLFFPCPPTQANSSFCPALGPPQNVRPPALSSPSFYPAMSGAPGCWPLPKAAAAAPPPASLAYYCRAVCLCPVLFSFRVVPCCPSALACFPRIHLNTKDSLSPSCPVLTDLYPSSDSCKPLLTNADQQCGDPRGKVQTGRRQPNNLR